MGKDISGNAGKHIGDKMIAGTHTSNPTLLHMPAPTRPRGHVSPHRSLSSAGKHIGNKMIARAQALIPYLTRTCPLERNISAPAHSIAGLVPQANTSATR
jgi:hypothetical protein